MTSAFDVALTARGLLFGLAFISAAALGQGVQTPSNMLITGTIVPSTSTPQVIPGTNDLIQAINVSSTRIEGQGTVASEQGGFAIEMSKTSDFNGTQLSLRIAKTNGNVYTLANPDGTQFRFPYNGGFFPVTAAFSLRIASLVSAATPAAGATGGSTAGTGDTTPTAPTGPLPGCANPAMDVNGDGRCDEQDIELIKEYIAGRTRTIGRRDVNNDGVVNTRDVIDLIRSINQSRRPVAPNRREQLKNQ